MIKSLTLSAEMANIVDRIADLPRSAASDLMQFIARAAADSYKQILTMQISFLQTEELKLKLATMLLILLGSMYSLASLVTPIIRFPLRKVGVEFGDIATSILTLSIIVHRIELSPLDTPFLHVIFIALFPSANARSEKESLDYPRSKIKIERLKVRLTIKSRDESYQMSWAKRAFYFIFPRPMFVVKMKGVVIEVEKAYIAPAPPADFSAMTNQLPHAISMQAHPELLKFDQRYHLDQLGYAEILQADYITFCLERWIQYAVAKMRNNSPDSHANPTTSDDRLNSWISTLARIILQSISFYIDSASVIISGAGSDIVKETRQRFPPDEADLHLAQLQRGQRALTMIGTSMIKISFSSDTNCNLLICFGGLQVKVGNPRVQRRRRSSISNKYPSSCSNRWEWSTIVKPFDCVAEVKGVIPFVMYSIDYDHFWEERVLGLNLTVSSEISLTMSPIDLHTLFLHLDDYTDTNSTFNQWFEWMKRCHQQTLKSSSTEKWTYCRNYERKNVGKIEHFHQVVSQAQMRQIEQKMQCSEIMTLRCIAMKDLWRVPKESTYFADYLQRSRSEINIDNIDNSVQDSSSPFQRTYATALDALVTLITEKASIFTPRIELKCRVGNLNIDFPSNDDENLHIGRQQTIPSVLSMSSVSFSVEQVHPLFAIDKNASLDTRRQFVGLSVKVNDLNWTVRDVDLTRKLRLPTFSDKSFVCVAYKNPQEGVTQKDVLDVSISLSVAPSPEQDIHASVALSSSDVTIVGNPLPLRSACQCLLDLSYLPFQETTEVSLFEDTASNFQNDNNIWTLSTSVIADIERIYTLFLVDAQEVSRGLLHFAINSVQMQSTSIGMGGELLVSSEPFVLSAAQVTQNQPNSRGSCLNSRLLPFKPVVTVTGAEAVIRAEKQSMNGVGPQQVGIDVKMGVESTELNASPSTAAALLGAVQSLVTLLELEKRTRNEEVANEEELQKDEMRTLKYQRAALLKTFRSAGVTSVDILEEDDIEKIVHLNRNNCAQHLTAVEIEREKEFLRSLAGESLTLDKLNTMLFRIANGIDDSSFASSLQAAGIEYVGSSQRASFSSELTLHNLIYFGDLREYSSMHEVYRITGEKNMYSTSRFPAPILWHLGQGVDLFWEFYVRQCGCSRESLCGQEIKTVQQKLVRSLCNYEFAKYCWKTLVQPGLIHNHNIVETNWLLDDDPTQPIRGLFASLLLSITEESKELEKADRLTTYAISVSVVIDYAAMSFGSAQNFTKPLFEARVRKASLGFSAFLSQDGKFIGDCESYTEHSDTESPTIENVFNFCSGELDVSYLNTKHDNMEHLIEPYLCLGRVSYITVQQHETDEEPSIAIDVKCPQTLFINISPVLFETLLITTKLISQADPTAYKKALYERDKRYLYDTCEANPRTQRGSLTREDAASVLRGLDFEGLSEVETDKKITALMNAAKTGDVIIRTSRLEYVLNNDGRCFFSGCRKLLLLNSVGVSMTVTAKSDTKIIESGNTIDLSLGKVSLAIERYQIIDDIPLSPYQPAMLKLSRHSKHGRRTKRTTCGFAPFLTVVPNQDSLDAVKLKVRSSIQIKSEIPIRVRIVRLPKRLGYLQKRSTKQVDLTKKNLAAALRRVVSGALIVHEMLISEESVAAIPLNIVLSTHYHALLFQDVSGEESDTWRDPVLLSKDFLFNEMNLREVSKCHTLSGINVRKERLNVHSSVERSGQTDTMRSIWSRTAWDTTICVVPFFLLSNAMPFPILIKAWQMRVSDENEMWRDPTMFTDTSEHFNENESNSDGETSSKSPSLMGRSTSTQQYHFPTGSRGDDYYSLSCLESGKTLRLCGINLSCPLYLQFSQKLRGTLHEWSNVAKVNLHKLRTGINPNKGTLSLKSLPIRLGDTVDCYIDTAVECGICRGALYSPFWISNQSGMKLEYRVIGTKDYHGISNKRYLDAGNGGLPVMLHCDNEGENDTGKHKTKQISVIPLENPSTVVLGKWWDEQRNGRLVLVKNGIKDGNNSVDWSEKIEMNTAGTSGEVHCSSNVVLSVSVESMAGVFFRSNFIRFTPRFVVRNSMHMPISLVALSGSTSEAIHKTRQLRYFLTDRDTKATVDLAPGESTVIYSFDNTGGVGKTFRWISFRVNATRYDENTNPKWHLIRLDRNGSTYLGEVDRRNVMVGIIDATVNRSDGCSLLCTISHASVPPYRIENRSNTHFVRFAQHDDDAVVFELPPMHSCGYTWDNPHGKKRLRAEVVHKGAHDYRNDKSESGSYAFGLYSRLYKMNAGRKQTLQYSYDDCHFSIHSHVRISAGTKILSFNDSDFMADAVESGITSKDSSFENAVCDIDAEGVSISVVDNFPKELLAITVRDVSLSKPIGSNEIQVLVRHFQVDAMDPDARNPIIIRPLPFGVDERKPRSNELTLPENINSSDLFWMEHVDERPSPVFEANFKYVPQKNMMWIPSLNVFLCPMKVVFDLEYILRVTGVFIGSITQYRDDASSASHTAAAGNTNDKLQYSSGGAKTVSLTYLERLTIAPVWFEVEISINDLGYYDGDGLAAETALSLNSLAQASNSSFVAGIVGWVVNVGSNFAHVTPCFKYPSVAYIDKFCDPIELVKDIVFFYVMQTIKQSLKVVFSMQFLGDPTLLALQLRTGFSDLVIRTSDEVRAGGSNGFGRGIASFSENAIGGTLKAVGKVAKSIAKTTDALVTTELSSKHLKPRELEKRKRPRHAIDGLVQGTQFLGRELVHGTAGLIGCPYRGAQKRKISSLAKGVATGVGGLVVSPAVALFGFVALSSEGLGATTKYLELSEIEARCRPERVVPWGMPISCAGLSFLKAIGIRVHSVRYQKVRKAVLLRDQDEGESVDFVTSKEHKRIQAAEMRRTNPPSKVLCIKYKKENRRYTTTSVNPKLLTDHPGSQTTSHYAAIFEQTLILRANNLQLEDEVNIQFRNNKNGMNTSSSTLGTCKLRVGDIYSHLLKLHQNELVRRESRLSEEHAHSFDEITAPHASTKSSSLIVPAPQEFTLMRPVKKLERPLEDVFEVITNEMRDIQRCEEELKKTLESESIHSDSSFPGYGIKKKEEDIKSILNKNERLFGFISLSFFPIKW